MAEYDRRYMDNERKASRKSVKEYLHLFYHASTKQPMPRSFISYRREPIFASFFWFSAKQFSRTFNLKKSKGHTYVLPYFLRFHNPSGRGALIEEIRYYSIFHRKIISTGSQSGRPASRIAQTVLQHIHRCSTRTANTEIHRRNPFHRFPASRH